MDYKIITLSRTNCYLIEINEGFLLVDCGNSHDRQTFLNGMKKWNIEPADIRFLFLTHHHNDHCGLLQFLKSVNPDMRVILSGKCAEFLSSGMHHRHKDEKYSNHALHLIVDTYKRLDRQWSESFPPYFTCKEDIVIETDSYEMSSILGLNLVILQTPGHTEDSMSLIAGESSFIGDAARNMLNFTGSPYQPMLIYDLGTCLRSWRKIIDSGSRELCPSHGRPFDSNILESILKQTPKKDIQHMA